MTATDGKSAETATASPKAKPRTCVLIVHGMGNQRPLETLRGLFNGAFTAAARPRMWLRPSHVTGTDLPVITTRSVEVGGRSQPMEFHEFYWAHHMGETRFVAAVLWLLELMRKGPEYAAKRTDLRTGSPPANRPDIQVMWWLGAVFLALAALAAVSLATNLLPIFGIPVMEHGALVGAVVLVLVAAALASIAGRWGLIATIVATALWIALHAALQAATGWNTADPVISWFPLHQGSVAGKVGAVGILVVFALANAFFLQTVFGDAARYLRNSPANIGVQRAIRAQGVEMLEKLHASRRYDRIIVVAHSLGTVVAYDMLRAYWARVSSSLGERLLPGLSADEKRALDALDAFGAKPVDTRGPGARIEPMSPLDDGEGEGWRESVRAFGAVARASQRQDTEPDLWLVSDFVTLGSPLTHARYLFGRGITDGPPQSSHIGGRASSGGRQDALDTVFRDPVDNVARRHAEHDRKRWERERPQAPAWFDDASFAADGAPSAIAGDGRLLFATKADGQRGAARFHHAALFGLTVWTNLYFRTGRNPLRGDPIGGPLRDVYGTGIADVALETSARAGMAHTRYWDVIETENDEHLVALRKALGLHGATTTP